MQEEDLEEFVREGIKAEEELIWFGRPNFFSILSNEFASTMTRKFLILVGVVAFLNILVHYLYGFSIIMGILFIIAFGAAILRFAWIYYLARRLTYAITSKRLVYLLESGRPIEYKTYDLSTIGSTSLIDADNGLSHLMLTDLKDALYGLEDGVNAEKALLQLVD